jgi:hypothetical protein
MNSRTKTARRAGALYLIYILVTIFADASRSRLITLGNAAATANNILASGQLFRVSFVSDILAGVLFLLTAWALYVLLKPVNQSIALLFVFLNLGGVAIQCMNMLNLFSAALLLSGADYLKVIPFDQLHSWAMFFIVLYKNGFMIAQFFFAAWLFPLGYLVFKSGYLPRILGVILMVECVAWIIYPFQFFLFPGFVTISYLSFAVGFIGEFSLTFWLLIKGAKEQEPGLV